MQETFHLITAPNGVQYLTCDRLKAPHGFSTRVGGISAGEFSALNLGASAGDDAAHVQANRATWAAALGFAGPIPGLHQVHGADVFTLDECGGPEAPKGDALIGDRPGAPLGIYTADCTPILLHDPVTGAVGAVHAGWRGTAAGVAREAVAALGSQYGARPADLQAAIGPTIGPCCFEVGDEVVTALREALPEGVVVGGPTAAGKPTIDLFEANRRQLVAAGLDPANVQVSGLCTHCRADLFFSWRRDGGKTGRMQAAIAATAPR